jgi:hypothetical protein
MFGPFVGTFLVSLPAMLKFLGVKKLIISQAGDGWRGLHEGLS